jgi:hypothetical protein
MYTGTLPPVSNRATWSEDVQCFDDEDNSAIDISAATAIELEVRDGCNVVLTASYPGSITLSATTGVFSFSFTADQMRALCAKTYDIGCTVTLEGETIQIIAGQLPVTNGYVR